MAKKKSTASPTKEKTRLTVYVRTPEGVFPAVLLGTTIAPKDVIEIRMCEETHIEEEKWGLRDVKAIPIEGKTEAERVKALSSLVERITADIEEVFESAE